MNSKPTVIVYRDELLGVSETFIRAQAESLSRYSPYFVGLRPRPGLELPEERTHVMTDLNAVGRVQRARFKFFGPNAALVRRLAKLQPSLIHAHFGPDACNALALAEQLRVPMVVSLHGYDITRSDSYHSQFYLRRRDKLQEKAARFLCVSNFIRAHSLLKGFPANRTVVHYTGVDTTFFKPKPDVSRLPVVLFVGRLVAEKGCTNLIQAMQRVQRQNRDAKLIVIGDGPLREELEREAAARLTAYEFVGAKRPEIVRDWMNCASLFCLPSASEGFGMVAAEAQAMGLPVVGFANGGIPEAVADGETGFLVPNGEVQQLADRVIQVMSDEDLRARMGQAGTLRVANCFDIRKQALKLESIYDQAIAEAKALRGVVRPRVQTEMFTGTESLSAFGAELPPSPSPNHVMSERIQ